MKIHRDNLSTEAEFQDQLIDLAHLYHWRVAHFRSARTLTGWTTPVSADGKGWPDLVLVKQPRVLFVECKSSKGRLTQEQKDWLAALKDCSKRSKHIEVYLWKPEDWDDIVKILYRESA